MSTDIVESLPERKHAPVAAAPAKGKPEAKKGGGSSEEGSEKRIRQAVYDIRYRARREDIDLKAAYSQYMSNSNLSQQERAAVREKLFGKEGGGVKEQFTVGADEMATNNLASALYKVFVEDDQVKELELAYLSQLDESSERKYKVRVTDKNGRTYVRFATRAKITELRANPNIKSVEMTEHGDVVGSERKRGKQTAKAKRGLDPVGKEDADIDNDGKPNDKNDRYIRNRRNVIKNSIRNRAEQKIKEAYGATGSTSVEAPTGSTKVKEQKIDNIASGAVKINPTDKQEDPSVAKARGVYAHLQLLGTNLSESQKKLLELVAEKKKKEAESYSEDANYGYDKEGKSLNPKDKKEEEKKDMRGYYAKINVIKNKLRAMGAKDPCVIADPDDVEKTWDKDKKKDDDVKEEKTAADWRVEADKVDSKYDKLFKDQKKKTNQYGKPWIGKPKDVDEGVQEVAGKVVNVIKRVAAGAANWANEEQAATQEDGAKVRELKNDPKYKWGREKKKEK